MNKLNVAIILIFALSGWYRTYELSPIIKDLGKSNIELRRSNATLKTDLHRSNYLIGELFNVDMTDKRLASIIEYPTKMTFYTLSEDETDSTPLEAALGKSRHDMIAPSPRLERMANMVNGERYAVLSKDGDIRSVGIFRDRLSQKNTEIQVDIVTPHKEITRSFGVKDGRIVKLVLEDI